MRQREGAREWQKVSKRALELKVLCGLVETVLVPEGISYKLYIFLFSALIRVLILRN